MRQFQHKIEVFLYDQQKHVNPPLETVHIFVYQQIFHVMAFADDYGLTVLLYSQQCNRKPRLSKLSGIKLSVWATLIEKLDWSKMSTNHIKGLQRMCGRPQVHLGPSIYSNPLLELFQEDKSQNGLWNESRETWTKSLEESNRSFFGKCLDETICHTAI